MKVNILIDPGIIPFPPLKDSVDCFLINNKLTIINDDPMKNGWDYLKNKCDLISYKYLENDSVYELDNESIANYKSLVQYIINDHRTLLIYERVKKIFAWNSIFNGIQNIEIIIYNSARLLLDLKPDRLIFQATPHNITSWILAKTAEFYGIKVNSFQTSPLPWRYWIVEGLDEQIPIYPNKPVLTTNDDKNIIDYYWKLNTSDYKTALPIYESKRIQARGGKYWSWKKELIEALRNPKLFLSLLYKRKLYKTFNSLIQTPDLTQKYIVFFLHYQPERTSLPEGGIYGQQWMIIRQLSMSLPKNWTLLVKEHPSTFTGRYDVRYRRPEYYKHISNLPNTKLVSIETDTFDLIDSSRFIVTITGTVGVQSLMRGVPVIVFGCASYRQFKDSVFYIDNIDDLIYLFNKDDERKVHPNDVCKYLHNINSYSISGSIVYKNFAVYDQSVRIDGHINLLSSYLKEE